MQKQIFFYEACPKSHFFPISALQQKKQGTEKFCIHKVRRTASSVKELKIKAFNIAMQKLKNCQNPINSRIMFFLQLG
jgi:hypothetical protein